MGRKQDSFRQNLMAFVSIILRSLVIFAEQFFSALVGGSGNGGLTFAPLPDADAEMWAGDLFLTVLSFGVAGLPAQGLFSLRSVSFAIVVSLRCRLGDSFAQHASASLHPAQRALGSAPCCRMFRRTFCSKWRRKPERPPRRAQLHRANGV